MNRLIQLLSALLFASLASAQTVTVSASHLGGTTPVTGTITFQPALANGTAASVGLSGGGGITSRNPFTTGVSNGVFTISGLADTSLSNPANLCYVVTVRASNGLQVLGPGFSCVQPAANNSWCASGTCNFDNYVPALGGLALVSAGPPGPAGANGCLIGTTGCSTLAAIATSGNATDLHGNFPAIASQNVNGTLNAALFAGADILAQAQAAFVSCSFHCTVLIPPNGGTPYTATSSIDFPLYSLLGASLIGHGVVINYTGVGCAVTSHEVQPNPTNARIKIEGIRIVGTGSGRCGMEWYPTSDITLDSVRVTDFSNGDGISIYGTENVHIDGASSLAANKYGLRIEGVGCRQGTPDYGCGPAIAASSCNPTTFTAGSGSCTYAGNMIRVKGVAFDNLTWSVYEQAGPQNIEHLNDSYRDSEFNGGGGGVWLEMSRATAIRDNYFEAMTGTYIKLGNNAGSQPLFNVAKNTSVTGNYFTTNGNPSIDANDTSHLLVEENSEILGTLSPSFLNIGAMFGSPTNPAHMRGNTVASTNALARNGVAALDQNSAYDVTFVADQLAGNALDIVESVDEAGNRHIGNLLVVTPGNASTLGTFGVPSYGSVNGQPLCVDNAGNFVIASGTCRSLVPSGAATTSSAAATYSIPVVIGGTTFYLKASSAP